MRTNQHLPVAVIGAGPVGLAAAALLIASEIRPVIFEKGPSVASAVRSWSHVRVFSPWKFNIDEAARLLLKPSDWKEPDPEGLPTGGEMLRDYLEPLANHPTISENIRFNATVQSVVRKGFDKVSTTGRDDAPFHITWIDGDGREHVTEASAVIDASGTWFSPNPMGANGLPVDGEKDASARIDYGIPDVLRQARSRYANKKVLVVGAGHSAINAVLDLLRLQESAPRTRVVWSLRRNRLDKLFGGGLNDKLPARGELGLAARRAIAENRLELLVPFAPDRIRQTSSGLTISGIHNGQAIAFSVDEVIVATGFRPDVEIFRELRISLDPALEAPPALAPLIDPNLHSCGTVPPHGVAELSHPEKGFYIVGSKSYGRAPTFLMATGYEQVRSIVAEIAGDHEAARDVRLVLPETGVCNSSRKTESSACCGSQESRILKQTVYAKIPVLNAPQPPDTGCCGGPAKDLQGACCVKDEEAKKAGEEGCGCGTKKSDSSVSVASGSCCG